MSVSTSRKTLAAAITTMVTIEVVLCTLLLLFSGYLYFSTAGSELSFRQVVDDFFTSPALMVVAFLPAWMNRLANFLTWSPERLIRPAIRWPEAVRRFQQWMSTMMAWGASSAALVITLPIEPHVIVPSALLLFGLPMWLLEGTIKRPGPKSETATGSHWEQNRSAS